MEKMHEYELARPAEGVHEILVDAGAVHIDGNRYMIPESWEASPSPRQFDFEDSPDSYGFLTVPATDDRGPLAIVRICYDGDGWQDYTTVRGMRRSWDLQVPDAEDEYACRKFAIWCALQVMRLTTDPRCAEAVAVAARHVRGQATDEELAAADAAAYAAEQGYDHASMSWWASRAARATIMADPYGSAVEAAMAMARSFDCASALSRRAHADLVQQKSEPASSPLAEDSSLAKDSSLAEEVQ